MTTRPEDSLATHRRIWQFNADLDWPELISEHARHAQAPAGQAHDALIGIVAGTAAATGSERGHQLAPFVPLLERDLTALEELAAAGQVSWVWMALVDQIGTAAAMGAPGAAGLWPRLLACLPSIRTDRDEQVKYHWNRGLAALALGLPAIYRPTAGHELGAPVRFVPGARFELNLQAFLGHLVAAVEQHAALADVEPAWHQVLVNFGVLERARSLNFDSLVWMASVLHHRVGGQPLETSADYLRDSVDAVIAAGG